MKNPLVPCTCGSVCRNSGRVGWRNCGQASASEPSTREPAMRRRPPRPRRGSRCRRSRRLCRPGARGPRRRAAARAGARAAAESASAGRAGRRAPRAPSTGRRRARGRSRSARPAARDRRRRRRGRSWHRGGGRSPRARARAPRSPRRRRRRRRASSPCHPAPRTGRARARRRPSRPTSPASCEPALCGQTRPSASALSSTCSTCQAPGTSGSGTPSISPRTSRTTVGGSLVLGPHQRPRRLGAEIAPPRLRDPVGIGVRERGLLPGRVRQRLDACSALVGEAAQHGVRERDRPLEARPAHELDGLVDRGVPRHPVQERELERTEPQGRAHRRRRGA